MNMNMNPNSELVQSAVNVPNLVQVPDALISQAREFQQAMMMYTCAGKTFSAQTVVSTV